MALIHGGDIFAAAARLGVDHRAILDFSASINPLGPAPVAREAILAAIDRVVHYPSRDGIRLRKALARVWNVDPCRVLVGNGATELLFDWARHQETASGITTLAAPVFGEFHRVWPGAALCQLDQEESWPADGPVVFTRPANPTGFLVNAGRLLSFAQARSAPVLVDESFLDFVREAESLAIHARRNLFVLKSLTKFWALPGLRAGALIGDVDRIDRGRSPWAMNVLAEEAALASLQDHHHAMATREFVASESRWLTEQLQGLSHIEVFPPNANFVFIRMENAAGFRAFAESRRVLVRDCSGWPGLRWAGIRVAVRRRWENQILVDLLSEYLCDS